jgi:RES domain-containing protein
MSESRALALLEVLVHFAAQAPDRYVLGGADVSSDLEISRTALSAQQAATRAIGDRWVRTGESAVLSVPSVVVEERNFVLNPAHPDFRRIAFLALAPFEFDRRLFQAL